MKFEMNLLLAIIVFLVAGCQPGTGHNTKEVDYTPIAGTWKAEKGDWQVTIAKDGKITSAVHPLGTVLVKPNETTHVKMKDGSTSTYNGGDFKLIYTPENQEIEVSIEIKSFHIKYLDNEIKGSIQAIIAGPLSGDFMMWDADILEMNDYGPRFPQAEPGPKPTRFIKQP